MHIRGTVSNLPVEGKGFHKKKYLFYGSSTRSILEQQGTSLPPQTFRAQGHPGPLHQSLQCALICISSKPRARMWCSSSPAAASLVN